MKNKKALLKNFSIMGLAISTMSIAGLSFADPTPLQAPAPNNNSSSINTSMIISAINDLNHNMQKLAYAKSMAQNNDNYQSSPSLAQAAQVNTQKNQAQIQEYPGALGTAAIALQSAGQKTDKQNANSLTQFSDSALTYNMTSDDVAAAQERIKKREKLQNQLSWKTKASDSIYTDLNTGNSEFQKPSTLHDNYFNFASLMQPNSYTPDQQTAAHQFINYLSQKFDSLTDGINFGKLRTYLLTLQSKPDKLSDALKSFATSASYERYQLNTRALIAGRSVALNNLNALAAERSPITTTSANTNLAQLSQAIGVAPTTQKDPKTGQTLYVYASPLQISNFVTTHRTSSPQWYQQMMAAPPATVKRETLFILAEMETEMQRQHLDNERILATLSAQQLQSSASQAQSLKALANDVNQEISTITGDANKSAIKPLNNPGSTNPPQSLNPTGK